MCYITSDGICLDHPVDFFDHIRQCHFSPDTTDIFHKAIVDIFHKVIVEIFLQNERT